MSGGERWVRSPPLAGTAADIHSLVASMLGGQDMPLFDGAVASPASSQPSVPSFHSSASCSTSVCPASVPMGTQPWLSTLYHRGDASYSPVQRPANVQPGNGLTILPGIRSQSPAALELGNTLGAQRLHSPSSFSLGTLHATSAWSGLSTTTGMVQNGSITSPLLPGVNTYEILRSSPPFALESLGDTPGPAVGGPVHEVFRLAAGARSGNEGGEGQRRDLGRGREETRPPFVPTTLLPFGKTGLIPLTTERARPRACLPCRQLKKKCDLNRPCRACWSRGCADLCQDDTKVPACTMCRARRLKCDRQRPCSRCVKSGQANACTAQDRGGLAGMQLESDDGKELEAGAPAEPYMASRTSREMDVELDWEASGRAGASIDDLVDPDEAEAKQAGMSRGTDEPGPTRSHSRGLSAEPAQAQERCFCGARALLACVLLLGSCSLVLYSRTLVAIRACASPLYDAPCVGARVLPSLATSR